MSNPFTLKVIPPGSAFCNRDRELEELSAHVRNRENVVLFSPRRYGKTSLVRRLQFNLSRQKVFTVYTDFFMVTSLEDLSARIAQSIYSVLHQRESLLKKGSRFLKFFKSFRPVFKPSADGSMALSVEVSSPSLGGADLLERVMTELGDFVRQEKNACHIAFDEFQEITELRNGKLEGLLRRHIQEQRASYFFVGSRRRILLEMFNQRSRPFYQSAMMYALKPLPHSELTAFLRREFKGGGKGCSQKLAEEISARVCQYPYYAQLLAYNVFEIAGRTVKKEDIEAGFEKLLASERYGYEALVQGLTGPQIALLKALASDPQSQILSTGYMGRHKLSIGGIQYARKKLEVLGLIEKQDDVWQVVDPVFASWVAAYA